MEVNNLISGIIGAVFALVLSSIYTRITNSSKLNKKRRTIVVYLELIAIPKCIKYIEDIKESLNFLDNLENKNDEIINYSIHLDYMPMFNSDLLKSFNLDVLLQISYNKKTHYKLLEIPYTIDFLRNNMPHDIINDFKIIINEHLKSKNVKSSEIYSHLDNCSFYKKNKSRVIDVLKLRLDTASGLLDNLNNTYFELEGKSLKWFLKYLRKQ